MKTFGLLIGSVLTFISPIKWVFLIIFLTVLIDTIWAIRTTIMLNGRKSFKSKILRLGLVHKIFKYFATTLLMYMIDTHIFGGVLFGYKYLLSKSIAMVWLYVEGKSIEEKNIILGKKPFVEILKEALGFYKKVKQEIDKTKKGME